VLSPPGAPHPALAIAASRAGALGVVHGLGGAARDGAAASALAEVAARGRGRRGLLLEADRVAEVARRLPADALGPLTSVLLVPTVPTDLAAAVAAVHAAGSRALVVATSVDVARAAAAAGADGIVAKGNEAGGWVGDESAFVLSQRVLGAVEVPVWIQGGMGLRTVAAAAAAGAEGVVLDAQLLLTRESPLPDAWRARLRTFDGSETAVLGAEAGLAYRAFRGSSLEPFRALAALEPQAPAEDVDALLAWRQSVEERVGWDDPDAQVLAVGQDAAAAAELADRFTTVSGVVQGLRGAAVEHLGAIASSGPLDEGSPMARSHGTRYAIVQGPMTRVSDRPAFAAAVAEGGGLPFLALALLRGPEVSALLRETAELLGDRPWGVGILGFVPPELRAEQLAAIRANRPPFALIAGGRPDQARALEDDGIPTYLHVPSPALLRLYVAQGATRFVFEGQECGGHVGPRSSFALWDAALGALEESIPSDASAGDYHVLLAGGVHDALSAAMASAAAASVTARGVRVGVLVGTAYLFTHEAVATGAITEGFQHAAVAGSTTTLLHSGPGQATRCLPSPFVDEFADRRRHLLAAGTDPDELRQRLEELTIGRLRIAAKGVDRTSGPAGSGRSGLAAVDDREQWDRGMYMIGQVVALRQEVTGIAALHHDLAHGSAELLAAAAAEIDEGDDTAAASAPVDVAIVGMGCIFPGAPDVERFWANVLDKVDAVGEVPRTRWDWRAYYEPDRREPDKVVARWGGFVDDVVFDPVAFGMPPMSLRSIEPFQLLALLTAKAALDDAGYARRPFPRERTSVILGAGGGGADLSVGYTVRSALPALFGDDAAALAEALGDRLPQWTEDSFPGVLMNVAAGRISNRLDLGGTNLTVDAACASSLAAVALAVRELQVGASDMVVAGGIDAIQNPFAYLCFSNTNALSPTGRCRPFDAAANGIAISEGFGAVVLKRLADAERDGDRIYAVVRGIGSSSDGRDRSITAPRPEGQVRALRRAYAQAGVSPTTIGLVEAHGTGTVAGDSAEVEALSLVYGEAGGDVQRCAIGSVKSNIGHTKAAAGVAGLMKAALALHHKVLPPTIGVTTPNPRANFAASPFYVNTEARPWVASRDHPRRAAVSAFGFGGTNFHAVLEEHTGAFLDELDDGGVPRPAELLLWRGTVDEVRRRVDAVARTLADDGGTDPARLAELAMTLAHALPPLTTAGEPGQVTLAVVAQAADLAAQLDRALAVLDGSAERHHADGVHLARSPLAADGQVAFLFPGQGSQYVDMARDVTLAFPELRRRFEQADAVLAGRHPRALSRFIFPPPSFTPDERRERQDALTMTQVAQPALGAAELAYLDLLRAFGVDADMVAGHSYGELVALAAASVFDDETLLVLSELRGRAIEEEGGDDAGSMVAVQADEAQLAELLRRSDLVVANHNAPGQLVLSGSRSAIADAVAWCAERELMAKELPVACAFHSPLVAPARDRLAEALAAIALAPPRLPVFSNTTAARYPDDGGAIAALLRDHLVQPVAFQREVEAMHDAGARLFVEVGPRSVLTGLVGRILEGRPHVAVPVDLPGRHGVAQLLEVLATLAAEGVPVDPRRLFAGRRSTAGDALPPPASAWLVNGGKARPAGTPLPDATPIDLGVAMSPARDPQSSSVVAPGSATPPPAAVPAAPVPAVAMPAAPLPVGSEADVVMAQYHHLMGQLIETERAVMLTYLGQPAAFDTPAAIAAPSLPAALTAVANGAANGAPNGAAKSATNGATNGAANGSADVHAAAVDDPQVVVLAEAPTAPPGPAPVPVPVPVPSMPAEPPDVGARFLQVVSERTGYPVEMLDLDAHMEADLGIDSIKRVEIAGTMLQSLGLPDGAADPEELLAARTLRQAVEVLGRFVAASGEDRAGVPF